MKKLSFIVFIVSFIAVSCSNDENSQEEDSQKLDKMYDEIVAASLANSEPCTNPQEWSYVATGAKACGGYATYVVYSKKIDTEKFLEKIKKYSDAQKEYNKKWGAISDCAMLVVEPTGIKCSEGKPVLTYSLP
ncbi:hypothetical protein [Flavobacterium limi]|uniref:Uncharacterized protein n=1 Tax=Flavobacterium limi TaxID=2045105 RepID=A0ABQ1UG18_9FLAO|nr:hypothetical protein [Flavobacterium limi]GGF17233.1 hypothetical protein GCM10011518_28310 [Flavobacterium limi]